MIWNCFAKKVMLMLKKNRSFWKLWFVSCEIFLITLTINNRLKFCFIYENKLTKNQKLFYNREIRKTKSVGNELIWWIYFLILLAKVNDRTPGVCCAKAFEFCMFILKSSRATYLRSSVKLRFSFSFLRFGEYLWKSLFDRTPQRKLLKMYIHIILKAFSNYAPGFLTNPDGVSSVDFRELSKYYKEPFKA